MVAAVAPAAAGEGPAEGDGPDSHLPPGKVRSFAESSHRRKAWPQAERAQSSCLDRRRFVLVALHRTCLRRSSAREVSAKSGWAAG